MPVIFVETARTKSSPATGVPSVSEDPMFVMTRQVREVLPHVPVEAIQADLGKRRTE